MTRKEFSIFAMALKTYYPKENILPNEQAMTLWFKHLEDIPYQVAEIVLDKWVALNKWSPSIADIRKMASETVTGKEKDWSEAWEELKRAVRLYGAPREKEALESMSPLTREIVKRFGFKEYCFSENEDAYKANFRMAYEREAKKREETAQLPEVLQARLNGILQIGEENGKDDME